MEDCRGGCRFVMKLAVDVEYVLGYEGISGAVPGRTEPGTVFAVLSAKRTELSKRCGSKSFLGTVENFAVPQRFLKRFLLKNNSCSVCWRDYSHLAILLFLSAFPPYTSLCTSSVMFQF